MKPEIILVEPILPEIEAELDAEYLVHRLSEPGGTERAEAAAERIEAVVTGGGTGLSRTWFDRLPNLRLVAVNGVGTDKVDLEHAAARGIRVSTTPGVLTDAVADLGIALILAVARRVVEGDRMVRSGDWARGGALPLGSSLRGRTLGVLGLGQIGRAVAARATAFGMDIAYFNRSDVDAPEGWARAADPVALAARSDALAVCMAGTAGTEGMVGAAVLDALGPEGILVNVARGSVVDEDALVAALRDGRIAGAGLDVFREEPLTREDLRALPNVVLMPHQGSATLETRRAMGRIVLENLRTSLPRG